MTALARCARHGPDDFHADLKPLEKRGLVRVAEGDDPAGTRRDAHTRGRPALAVALAGCQKAREHVVGVFRHERLTRVLMER